MWRMIGTNSLESANAGMTKEEIKALRVKQDKAFRKAMKTVKSDSYENLKKDGNKAFALRVLRDASIVEAYEKKKLRSKSLIKKAKAVKNTVKKSEQTAKTE